MNNYLKIAVIEGTVGGGRILSQVLLQVYSKLNVFIYSTSKALL